MSKIRQEASDNYDKLKDPRTMSKDLYIIHWVNTDLELDLTQKSLQLLATQNPYSNYKSSIEFFDVMPYELVSEIGRAILSQFPESNNIGVSQNAKTVWEKYKLPVKKIERHFISMTKERNEFARRKGFLSQIEMAINRYQISETSFDRFVKNSEKIIEFCNKQILSLNIRDLPNSFLSVFGSHCYLCQIPSFAFNDLNEVFEYVVRQSRILKKFQRKIKIIMGEDSHMRYRKETDDFEIMIDKNQNIRHKTLDLIHELCHVDNLLINFSNSIDPLEQGVYVNEYLTLKKEMFLLKKISPFLYKAKFGEFLKIFHSVLFQLELYKNPAQNLNKLYANIFNKCFFGGKQKSNPLYITDKNIVLNPLKNLPHAVAQAEYIDENLKIFNKKIKKNTKAKDFLAKIVEVAIDRPLGSKHPKHGFVYEVNYGFIPGTKSPDGEELDAYFIGEEKPLKTAKGRCIAIIHRTDDHDDKLVVCPVDKNLTDEEIEEKTAFQEKWFEHKIIRAV